MSRADRSADQELFDVIRAFVAISEIPEIDRFRDSLGHWGSDWVNVAPKVLPASAVLNECLSLTIPDTHFLVEEFHKHRASRQWEQSYTKEDGVVGEDMLQGYGFAEIVGQRGPFVSNKIRSGMGVWARGITYPVHQHQPEEIYVIAAGSAVFTRGDRSFQVKAGDAIHVPPGTLHGFRTTDEPIAVFYMWQAGNLREMSQFG